MPFVEHQLIVQPDAYPIIRRGNKAVEAWVKMDRPLKTGGEGVGCDGWIGRVVAPQFKLRMARSAMATGEPASCALLK